MRQSQAAYQDITSGATDLVWINGANFRAMREQDTLFGPFATALPSAGYFDFDSDAIKYDFGYPTDGYEMPYNSAQVVFIYNKAHIAEPTTPPMTIPELIDWIKANPGKFKYSQPPSHFTVRRPPPRAPTPSPSPSCCGGRGRGGCGGACCCCGCCRCCCCCRCFCWCGYCCCCGGGCFCCCFCCRRRHHSRCGGPASCAR